MKFWKGVLYVFTASSKAVSEAATYVPRNWLTPPGNPAASKLSAYGVTIYVRGDVDGFGCGNGGGPVGAIAARKAWGNAALVSISNVSATCCHGTSGRASAPTR